jgi:uncharacterized protein
MKFVFTSDLHGNKQIYREFEQLVNSTDADAVMIGGDLFEYSPDAEAQVQFAEEFLTPYFKNLNKPIYVIHGNADRPKAVQCL